MMKTYRICDLVVNMDLRYPLAIRRSEKYLIEDSDVCDILLNYVPDKIQKLKEMAPNLSEEECEVVSATTYFYTKLLEFNGCMLHSSAVAVDNKAYLFSAPSGTGKSTHTKQWRKLFGDRASIINDDKPAIRIIDGKIYVYGTPWSGSSDLNLNVKVPLQGICMLERSEENYIKPIEDKSVVIYEFMNQTIRPYFEYKMDMFLDILDTIVTNIPVWRMGCNISTDAAKLAYETMSK